MDPKDIALVQSTFEPISQNPEQAAELFYNRLFELDPALRVLFIHDMKQQGAKLIVTLRLAVKGLSDPESIILIVKQLGQRHVGYGVRTEHYNTVGAALLWMLEQMLGQRFTPEVQAAWTQAYTLLSGLMTEDHMDLEPLA